MNTKTTPGCVHALHAYLSQKSGLPTYLTVVRSFKQIKQGKRLAYPSRNITVVDIENNNHPYMEDGVKFDKRGVIAKHFEVSIYRNLEDYGIKLLPAGQYCNSLGNGWSEKIMLYKVDEQYFAPSLNCSCHG